MHYQIIFIVTFLSVGLGLGVALVADAGLRLYRGQRR
jgi:hypothetical protein